MNTYRRQPHSADCTKTVGHIRESSKQVCKHNHASDEQACQHNNASAEQVCKQNTASDASTAQNARRVSCCWYHQSTARVRETCKSKGDTYTHTHAYLSLVVQCICHSCLGRCHPSLGHSRQLLAGQGTPRFCHEQCSGSHPTPSPLSSKCPASKQGSTFNPCVVRQTKHMQRCCQQQ